MNNDRREKPQRRKCKRHQQWRRFDESQRWQTVCRECTNVPEEAEHAGQQGEAIGTGRDPSLIRWMRPHDHPKKHGVQDCAGCESENVDERCNHDELSFYAPPSGQTNGCRAMVAFPPRMVTGGQRVDSPSRLKLPAAIHSCSALLVPAKHPFIGLSSADAAVIPTL